MSQKPGRRTALLTEYIIAVMLTVLVTGAAAVLEPLTGYLAIALLYLLLVVAAGIKLHRGPVLLIAASSALVWDFFFIPPRFNLHIADLNDLAMFSMFFVVAIAMGHLTSQLRLSEITERRRQQHTGALYELVHQAGLASDLDTGLRAALGLTETVFGVRASLLLRLSDHSLDGKYPPALFRWTKKNTAWRRGPFALGWRQAGLSITGRRRKRCICRFKLIGR